MNRSRFIILLLVILASLGLLSVSIAFADPNQAETAPSPVEIDEKEADVSESADSKSTAEEVSGTASPDTAGGPDAFGYTYQDSNEITGPPFSWAEITGTTNVPFGDDTKHGPFPIGFTFNFYGTDYTDIWLGSNGWMSVGATDPGSTDSSNDCPLPNSFGNENIIAALWDDLDQNTAAPDGTGWYQSFTAGSCPYGAYPGACFVAEWSGMYHWNSSPADDMTFEIILFDNNDILVQILDASNEAGLSSTTGLENADASDGLTYGACNTGGSIADNLAIQFDYPPPTARLDNSSKSAPTVALVGDILTYSIALSNTGDLTATNAVLTDAIPSGTTYVLGSVSASSGAAAFDGANVTWNGDVGIGAQVDIAFAVDTTGATAGAAVVNTAVANSPAAASAVTLTAVTNMWDSQLFFSDFEGDNGGLTSDNEWEWGMPVPPTSPVAYSGSNLWGTDLDGNYDASTTSVLTFTVDLSSLAGSPAVSLSWWEWFTAENCCDELFVRGSSTSVLPTVLYGSTTGGPTLEQEAHEGQWFNVNIDITQFAGEIATFTFVLQPDSSVQDAGWYIDNLAIYNVTPPPVNIALNKTVGTDPNSCATTNSITVAPNTDVTYCYEVTNTGAVTLTLHDLVDTELGTILSGLPFTLTAGSSVAVTQTVNLTQTAVNTATWTAYNAGPADVVMATDTASVTVVPPSPVSCNGPTVGFDSGIPSDWTVANNAPGNPVFWTNVAGSGEAANYATGNGDAASASSDLQGGGSGLYDTELWTNPFDLTGFTQVSLNYWALYGNFAFVDFLELDISTDGGSSWTNLLSWNEDHHPNGLRVAPGENVTVDLSAYAGQSNVILRWHYYDPTGPLTSQDWYAQIDEVALSCLAGTLDVSLVKTVGTNPAVCAATDTLTVPGGSDVYYCYEVTNTGTVTATVHDLADDKLGAPFTGFAYDLAPGASVDTVALGVTISATINTTTTNTATWTAYNGSFSAVATDTATVIATLPQIQVDTSDIDETISTGETVDVVITIDNLGNQDLLWTLDEEAGTRGPSRDIGGAWETMAPAPAGRAFPAVIADGNGYVYVIGGTSDGAATTPTNTVYRYATATNTWSTMASLPATMDSADGMVINNKIYVPGDDTTAGATYVYDIAANTWSTIAANGGFTARAQYQVTAIDTDLYVLGGIAAGASTTEVWVLDTTTGNWSAGVPMQKSRTSFSAAAIDGSIYVAGGVAFPGFAPDMTAEKFNGAAWSYIANVPDGGGAYTRWSYNADAHGADGLWLAAGRRDAAWNIVDHAGYYDPKSDTWTESPTIPTLSQGRVYMEGDVASDGYLYVIGGRDPAASIAYDVNERLMVGLPLVPCNPTDVPWLSVAPASGTVAAGGSQQVTVSLDATGLATGSYSASLCLSSNDLANPLIRIPVAFEVVERVNLQVAHLAPFAAGSGTAVTITLNSVAVLTDFAFADSTDYLSIGAGSYLIEVWPTGSSSPAITESVVFLPGMDYTVIAVGDGMNQPLDLRVLVDNNSAPAGGSFKLRLGHFAPFAAGPATADIRMQDGTPVLTDVVFSEVAPYLELPAGEYDLKITTPGGGATLIDPEPVTFAAGAIFSVFAVGDGMKQELGVFALPSGMQGALLPLFQGYTLYLPVVIRMP